jgi:SAM-dependent methyltransferase
MLSVAAEAAQREGLTNIKTRVMNAEDLTIKSDSFDAAISRIALMLFPNPVKALTEMRRVVRPGGKVSVIVFSTLEKNPYHGFLYETVRRVGNVSLPAKGVPWMYALGETGALEDVYRRANFLNISVQAVPIQRGRQSAADAVSNMRKGAGDAKELMNRLEDGVREQAWAEITEQFRRYEGPSGCEIPGEVLIGVGTK